MWPFKRQKRDKPGKRRPRGALEPLGHRARAGAESPTAQERAFAVGEPGWPVIDGPHYLDVLGALHRLRKPGWYLEIGAFKGHSLALCPGNYVAVDPQFQLAAPPPAATQGHLMQMTSDAFFASGFTEANALRFDLAFLDGLHLFEALLDDFIATEARMAPGGAILLHDCLPSSDEMEGRDWAENARFWTGDVWKVPLVLSETRPDLNITLLDAWPTGLAVIENPDPENRVLAERRDQLVAARRDLRLSAFGRDAYFDRFKIESAARFVQDRRAPAP